MRLNQAATSLLTDVTHITAATELGPFYFTEFWCLIASWNCLFARNRFHLRDVGRDPPSVQFHVHCDIVWESCGVARVMHQTNAIILSESLLVNKSLVEAHAATGNLFSCNRHLLLLVDVRTAI